MRIAMIGRDLPRPNTSGGVSGQMHMLACELARSENDVTVFALNPPATNNGYEYRPIPAPTSLLRYRRAALYLAPWWAGRIRLDDFDIVHTHGDDQFIRTGLPVVRTFYGAERAEARYSPSLRHRLYHLSMVPFEWVSQQRATALVVISRSTQQYLSRQAHVIPCGYDPALFYPKGPRSARPTILFVGDLGTRKRAELLLGVFANEVRAFIPDAELWMVTTVHVHEPGVRSFGRIAGKELAELYRQAWIYCMPSSYEGFGMPYLEAMASGTPVVATPNGGAEEVLDGGRTGRIVIERELGAELVRLLNDDSARAELTASGLTRAKHYRISDIAGRYAALYQSLVRNTVRSPLQAKI